LETRNSNGLDQFCSVLEERPGLSVLDLAAASQNTITFITGQGHRLCSDDFLLQLDTCFGQGDNVENQSDPFRVEDFLRGSFDFPDESFDGALIWDHLEYLSGPLLARVINRLHAVMRPGAVLLAMFHAQEHKQPIPSYSYRIQDRRTVQMTPRGSRKPASFFNNRNLEKLFENFGSVKFFLTRDALREVIVRR
jgi:hypothetical protein